MKQILVIDHDLSGTHIEHLLRDDGWRVRSASTGGDGLRLAGDMRPAVVIIDVDLPDMSGFDVLQRIRAEHGRAACLMTSRVASCHVAVVSLRIGAVNCLEKPVTDRALLDAVNEPVAHLQTTVVNGEIAESHSARRWAEVVVGAIDSPSDVRTLPEWGRYVGLSRGALRNWCRAARVPAKDSLRFTRLLRAVIRQAGPIRDPEDLLNIVDCRTKARLLALAGGSRPGSLPLTVEEFLQNQRCIQRPDALREVGSALQARRASTSGRLSLIARSVKGM